MSCMKGKALLKAVSALLTGLMIFGSAEIGFTASARKHITIATAKT